MKHSLLYRWLFFLGGLAIMAFGFTLVIKADRLGISPWDVLHVGLFLNFGLTIGTWVILMGLLLVAVSSLATRSLPQIGTFLNMLFTGALIDFYNFILPDFESLVAQTVILILGILISGFGIGIYVSPKIGAGPRDSIMLILVEKTGLSISIVRASMETLAAIAGWVLGGPVGFGTVAVALLTGRIVQYTLPMAERWLKTLIEKKNELPPVLKL